MRRLLLASLALAACGASAQGTFATFGTSVPLASEDGSKSSPVADRRPPVSVRATLADSLLDDVTTPAARDTLRSLYDETPAEGGTGVASGGFLVRRDGRREGLSAAQATTYFGSDDNGKTPFGLGFFGDATTLAADAIADNLMLIPPLGYGRLTLRTTAVTEPEPAEDDGAGGPQGPTGEADEPDALQQFFATGGNLVVDYGVPLAFTARVRGADAYDARADVLLSLRAGATVPALTTQADVTSYTAELGLDPALGWMSAQKTFRARLGGRVAAGYASPQFRSATGSQPVYAYALVDASLIVANAIVLRVSGPIEGAGVGIGTNVPLTFTVQLLR